MRHQMIAVAASVFWTAAAFAQADQAADGAVEASLDSGDIVVTARRRNERLQDVPISVQAFSQDTLTARGVVRATDLVNVTPTLKVSAASQRRISPAYELRGISSTETNITQDSPVALYIDEVYLGRPMGTNGAFVDLENVQVLLGPQGTLFGRNATAGAILLTSKKPVDRLEGEASVSLGNYDQRRLTGILNLPLADGIAVRLVGARSKRDGFTRDIVNDQTLDNENSSFGRASLRIDRGGLNNVLVGDIYVSNEAGSGVVPVAIRPNGVAGDPAGRSLLSLINGNATVAAELAAQQVRGPRRVGYQPGNLLFDKVRTHGLSNVTTIELSDQLTLKNVLGHRYMKIISRADLDGTRFGGIDGDSSEGSKTWSEELQLQGKAMDGSLNFIVGAYAFRETGFYDSVARQFSAITPVFNTYGKNQSLSGFAQATYQIPGLAGLSVTAGARYTYDKRDVRFRPPGPRQANPYGAAVCTHTPPVTGCGVTADKSFSRPTWTISTEYKPNNDLLFYVASRRGYRSGGFNARENNTLSQGIPFSPETVTDVELGAKTTWRLGDDVRLQANIAAYKTFYDDIQRSITSIDSTGVLVTRIQNAAKAQIKGFEANVDLRVHRYLELSASYGYADAIHKEFATVINGAPATLRDQPFGSLKNSGSATITVTPPLADGAGTLNLSGTAAYSGRYFNTTAINATNLALPFIDPTGRVPSRVIYNTTIGWDEVLGSPLSAEFFVRNLTNKRYLTSTLALYNTAAGFTSGLYGEPRLYGMTVKYRFGV